VDISITALTASRRFAKALVRVSGALAGLRVSCKDLDSRAEMFDTLQVVFVDQPSQHLALQGTQRGDRLFQVDVGMGEEQPFARDEDRAFLRMVTDQVLRAVREAPLTDSCRGAAMARIDAWRQAVDSSE
jgi:hypothetical protein